MLAGAAYAALGHAILRPGRRVVLPSAALGATAGVLVYLVRVITREYYEQDVYLIGGAAWAGIFLGVAVAFSHGALRGLGTFLTFSVATILAASIALLVVVRYDIAGLGG